MEEKIIETFYDTIMPSAREKDPTYVGDWPFYVNFDSNITGHEEFNSNLVINVKDKERFENALIEYTKSMIDHLTEHTKLQDYDNVYFEGNISNVIESVVLNVWFNATEEDFKDPIKYLKTRTEFLKDQFSNNNLGKTFSGYDVEKLGNCFVESYIDIQNPSTNETPFVFKSKIVNGEDEFVLPNIPYGICEGKCYIYAVHGSKFSKKTSFDKKVNRLLYKANKDLEITYSDENIKDVSLSHIFALTIFFKMLEDNNIKDIVVKNYYPVRSDNKDIVVANKIKKFKELEPSRDDPRYSEWQNSFNEYILGVATIHDNIINKYLRNFRRLEYQFSNINITSYPYELDNNMHIKLSEYKDYNKDHILNDLYESISFDKKLQK